MSAHDGIYRFEQAAGPQLDGGDVVHSDIPLQSPGMRRVISTYVNKVKILLLRDGQRAGGMSFRGDELVTVHKAVTVATQARHISYVGSIPLPSGTTIRLCAGCDRVIFRTTLPDGRETKPTTISGDELKALRAALSEVRVGGRTTRNDRRAANARPSST